MTSKTRHRVRRVRHARPWRKRSRKRAVPRAPEGIERNCAENFPSHDCTLSAAVLMDRKHYRKLSTTMMLLPVRTSAEKRIVFRSGETLSPWKVGWLMDEISR